MLRQGFRRLIASYPGSTVAQRSVLCRYFAADAPVAKSGDGSDDIGALLRDTAISQAKSWKAFAEKMMTVPLPLEASDSKAVHEYVMTALKFRKESDPITEMSAVLSKFESAEESNATFASYVESCNDIQDDLKLSPEMFTLFSFPKSDKYSSDGAYNAAKEEVTQLADKVLPSSCPKDLSLTEKLQYLEEYCRYLEDCKNTHNKADELARVLDGKWIEKPKVLKVASWIKGGSNKKAKDDDDEKDKTTYGMERILKL